MLHNFVYSKLKPKTPCIANPVKVVEWGSELIQLLLADALGVTGQDLVLNLIDCAGNSGEELLPSHADMLKCT